MALAMRLGAPQNHHATVEMLQLAGSVVTRLPRTIGLRYP